MDYSPGYDELYDAAAVYVESSLEPSSLVVYVAVAIEDPECLDADWRAGYECIAYAEHGVPHYTTLHPKF